MKKTSGVKSVKLNFIMNFILTVSSIIFPLITFPYISRVLLVEGNGIVSFATSVTSYFVMFASLGIPTYGIRACAAVRDDKEKLSKVVHELLIISTISTVLVYAVFIISVFNVDKFETQKMLFMINGISILLNNVGVNWFYNALEKYSYITVRSLIFKVLSIILMFIFVKDYNDYVIYGAILVFATAGSNILNFINLRHYITFKKFKNYSLKEHIKPILIFFGTSAAISIYTNLDILMLGFMRGDIDVGYYNASIKIKTILISLVTSLGTVILPRLSYYIEKKEHDKFIQMVKKAVNFVLVVAIPLVVYFIMFSKQTILLIAGKAFMGSVLPMQLLMPTVLLIGLSNVSGIQVLVPLKKEKELLISIICGAVVDFLLNIILIKRFGAAGAAFSTLVAEFIVLSVQCFYLRKNIWQVVKDISYWKIILSTGLASVVAFFLIGVFKTNLLEIIITLVTFFAVYLIMSLLLKEEFIYENISQVFSKIKEKLNKKE